MASNSAQTVLACVETGHYSCEGNVLPAEQQQTTPPLAELLAVQNAHHFVTRTGAITDEYLFQGGPPANFSFRNVVENLYRIESLVPGRPDYRRPEILTKNKWFVGDSYAVTNQLRSAVDEFKLLLKMSRRRARGSSAVLTTTAADPTLIRRSNTIVLPFKLRRGHKTRIRIKLRRGDVRKLARYAGRLRVLPVRIIVSFNSKPRPVARVFDIRLPVKPKTAKKPSRKGGGH
jgi:hypothetical protein